MAAQAAIDSFARIADNMFMKNVSGEPAIMLELVGVLYGGLLEDAPWEKFLRALARQLDAPFAVLLLTTPGTAAPGAVHTPDADPEIADDYIESFYASDPFTGLPEGQVVSFADFVAGRELNDKWRQFLEGSGSHQILGVDLRFQSGMEARLRVTRDRARADFGPAERVVLETLVPHLRQALQLFERIQSSEVEHGIFHGAIEQMAVGAIILDHQGRILRSNSVADRLIAPGDGIRLAGNKLLLTAPTEQAALNKLLRNPPAIGETQHLCIERLSGGRNLRMAVRAVSGPSYLGDSAAALALFISDPDQKARPSPEALRDIFQLTRMEASLAVALADGSSLIEAASRLGITYNTARSHLRATFTKTGARRQSQLVQLIQSSLAELSNPSQPTP